MDLNSYNYLLRLRQKYKIELLEAINNNDKQQIEFCNKQIELINDNLKGY